MTFSNILERIVRMPSKMWQTIVQHVTDPSALMMYSHIPFVGRFATIRLWKYHAEITAENMHDEAQEYADIIEQLTLSDERVWKEIWKIQFPQLKHLRLRDVKRFPPYMRLSRKLEILEFDNCRIRLHSKQVKTSGWLSEKVFTPSLRTFRVTPQRNFTTEESAFLYRRCPDTRLLLNGH